MTDIQLVSWLFLIGFGDFVVLTLPTKCKIYTLTKSRMNNEKIRLRKKKKLSKQKNWHFLSQSYDLCSFFFSSLLTTQRRCWTNITVSLIYSWAPNNNAIITLVNLIFWQFKCNRWITRTLVIANLSHVLVYAHGASRYHWLLSFHLIWRQIQHV